MIFLRDVTVEIAVYNSSIDNSVLCCWPACWLRDGFILPSDMVHSYAHQEKGSFLLFIKNVKGKSLVDVWTESSLSSFLLCLLSYIYSGTNKFENQVATSSRIR